MLRFGVTILIPNLISNTSFEMSYNIFLILDIDLPNEQGRMDILKIHAAPITKHGEIGMLIYFPPMVFC